MMSQPKPSHTALWRMYSGWYGPSLLWLIQLPISFWLVWHACGDHRNGRLYASVGTVLVVALATVWIERLRWREARQCSPADAVSAERIRFVALIGTLLSAQIILVCAAQLLAILIIGPCQ